MYTAIDFHPVRYVSKYLVNSTVWFCLPKERTLYIPHTHLCNIHNEAKYIQVAQNA